MHRRTVVLLGAVAALALLSGCSAAGSLDMQAVDDPALAADASRSIDDLAPTHPESERSPRDIVRAAIANGSTTVTAVSDPLTDGLPYEVDGTYYTLSSTVVSTDTRTAVSIRIDYNTTGANGTAVQYADLPPADREAIDQFFPQPFPPAEGEEFGVAALYTDAELNASVLAPTQQYDAVIYEGERYAITVDDPESVTVDTYRYDATRLAQNASAYATHLRQRYAFPMSGLSDAEQTVVTEAIEDGAYYAESTDDAAFESVVERFRSHDAIVGDRASGTWLVRYDGTLYLAELEYGAFLEE